MTLSIKSGSNGARVAGLTPQAVLGIVVCQSVFSKRALDLTITAGIDGKHMRASLHYSGNAWDMRSFNSPEADREAVRLECKTALGDDYDVVVEGDHLHGEYQPKSPYTGT